MNFILNDERFKSNGIKILTAGIDLSRFEKNPVCLDNHYTWNHSVLGYWKDIIKEGGMLKATVVFDTEHSDGKEIARKVEKGIIKGCNIGAFFNKKDLNKINGELVLTKCELFEASIVALPANANAVRFHHKSGEPYKEEELHRLVASFNTKKTNEKNYEPMDEILTMKARMALGLTEKEVTPTDAEHKILAMKAENEALQAQLKTFKAADEANKSEAIENLVNTAIREGRISGENKEAYVDFARFNFEKCKKQIEALPKKQTINAKKQGDDNAAMSYEVFKKMSHADQEEYREKNPDEMKRMFNELKID